MAKRTKAELEKMVEELQADNRMLKDVVQRLMMAPPTVQLVPAPMPYPVPAPAPFVPGLPPGTVPLPFIQPAPITAPGTDVWPRIICSDVPAHPNTAGCAAPMLPPGVQFLGTYEAVYGGSPRSTQRYS